MLIPKLCVPFNVLPPVPRVNRVLNPHPQDSFGWTPSGDVALSTMQDLPTREGLPSWISSALVVAEDTGGYAETLIWADEGETLTVSGYFRTQSYSSVLPRLSVDDVFSDQIDESGPWGRYSLTFTAQETRDHVVRAGAGAGGTVLGTGFLAEEGYSLGSYFDGDRGGFRFTGQPYRSTSAQIQRFCAVEQDSPEEIAQCVYAVLATEIGQREEEPEFGISDQAHLKNGADLDELRAAVAEWEPRALTMTDAELEGVIQRVRVALV